MEFVVVRCSDGADLPVWVDSVQGGRTEEVLDVQAGNHLFALCECAGGQHQGSCTAAGYRPVRQQLVVQETFAADPLEVRFEKA